MTIHNLHGIPSYPESNLQLHEHGKEITKKQAFSDAASLLTKESPVEGCQIDPSTNSSVSVNKIAEHILKPGYLPVVSEKRIIWVPLDSSKIVQDLSKEFSSLHLKASHSSAIANPSESLTPAFNPYIMNISSSVFEDKVNVGHNFILNSKNINIENLNVQFPSFFTPSFVEGVFNLPLPPPNFTGRQEKLVELDSLCRNNKRVIVSGLGGVGKTAIVLQYAEEHKAEYSFVHFIPAPTGDLLTEGLLHLANEQKIPPGKDQERLEMLKNHLNRFPKPFLLIFDGVDSLQCLKQLTPFLPHQGQSVVVTSRLAHEGEEVGFVRLELSPFTKEEAIAYLVRETGDRNENQASLLAYELGYLPLAIKHAAAYIKKNKHSLESYLLLFKQEGVKLHDTKYIRLSCQEKTIMNTWEISLKAISQECTASIKVAHFLSSLAHAPIPKALLEEWFKAFIDSSPIEFERTLGYLEDYSLLEMTRDMCNVHTLVQQVIHFSLPELEYKEYLREALKSLAAYSYLDIQIPESRSFLALFVPHFEEILHHLKKESLSEENKECLFNLAGCLWGFAYHGGKLIKAWEASQTHLEIAIAGYGEKSIPASITYNTLGLSLHALGKYQEALKYKREGLKIRQDLLPLKHPDIATSLNNVGITYGALGEHKEALKYKKEALKMRQELMGPKHPDLASSLDNVGETYGALGKHKKALKYQREALEMRRELLGPKHPDLPSSLNNVGETYGELGEHKEALKYKREALESIKELLGPKHPDVAITLNNVGATYGKLGDHKEALKYLREALEIRYEILGPKHPDIAVSLNNIGSTYGELGEHKEALKYLKEALEMRRELLGPKHPSVAISLNNVGGAYGDLGEHKEALKYQKEALEMRRELLGPKHPTLATSLNNVGFTYEDLGEHREALKYQKEALEMRRELLGPKHPDIAASLNNVGITYGDLGKHKKALKCKKEALEIRQEVMASKHPAIATSLDNVGTTYATLGEHKEALKFQKQALDMRQELLSPKHPDIAMSLNNVGSTYAALEDYKEALNYQQQALEMRQELLGLKHPDVAMSLNNVGLAYKCLGEYSEALKYQTKALEMRQELLGPKHPTIATSLDNVGATYGASGEHEKALKYQKEALKMRKEILGPKHPDVLTSLNAVVLSYKSLGKQEKALHYQTEALTIQQEMTQDEKSTFLGT